MGTAWVMRAARDGCWMTGMQCREGGCSSPPGRSPRAGGFPCSTSIG